MAELVDLNTIRSGRWALVGIEVAVGLGLKLIAQAQQVVGADALVRASLQQMGLAVVAAVVAERRFPQSRPARPVLVAPLGPDVLVGDSVGAARA